jgi:predicted permease
MTVSHDLRFFLRLLRKDPAFYLVAIVVLALGIGANTAIFSVVDGVLLRRAPVADLDRLAMVWETDRHSGTTREPASLPDFLDFQTRSRTFDTLAAMMPGQVNLTPPSGDPVRLAALRVTHELLPLIGVAPIAGRGFTAEEDVANGPRVAVISASLWERVFGRDSNAIGQVLRLDDEPYTVVGVVPDTTDFGVFQILSAAAYMRAFAERGERVSVDVWTPLAKDPEALPRQTHPIFVVGRLAAGATPAAAQTEMAGITGDLEHAYPENDGRGAHVESLSAVVFGPVRPALLVLLGAVTLVLLVACVNVANLMLARGATRAREVAVRRALGAGGGQLLRQYVVESVALVLSAAVAGVALAFGGLRALVALAPADIPRLSSVTIDGTVLAVTLVVSALVSVVFGLIPALQARRADVLAGLADDTGTRATGGRRHVRLRSMLVVAELALAVVLVAGAGLLIRSFWSLLQVDPGFRAQGVLKAEYQLPASRYPVDFRVWPDFKEQHAFTRALLMRAEALPGVVSAAVAGNHPLDPGFTNSFVVVGREAEARDWPEISVRRVTPGYFHTVGLSLVRGRLLTDGDTTTGPPVLLVNEAAAARFFAGRDPIGAQIAFWGARRTIVGVVANEKFHGLAEAAPIGVYTPLAQTPSASGDGVLLVRTAGDPTALAGAVRTAIHDLDPGLAVFGLEPLANAVTRSTAERRFTMTVLGIFAALALVLAAVGVHGVLSYGVVQRRREIGIRMALGAKPSGMLRLVMGEGFGLTLAGLALGLAGALVATRLLASLLYGVTPTDPTTFLGVAAVLVMVAAAATAVPAWRAAKVDPARALRAE